MSFKCERLTKTFHTRSGDVTALEDITFSANEHEFICIVGPSGCGKSTLLRIIADILPASSGKIIANSTNSTHNFRSALVFQEHGLFQWMTVLDNVAFGLEMQGIPKAVRRKKAREFIEQFGLGQFAENYPHELSIGMQQRVGIARAFLTDPELLLMDEPFGSLDAQTKFVLREELLRIWREHQKLVIFVTHDVEEAILLGDRVLVMTGRPGRIREDIRIPLERPRDQNGRDLAKITETKKRIWNMLEEEVRKNLWISD